MAICADEAGENPVAIGSVARVGNGAFRVSLTGDWYDIVSGRAKKGASGALARVIRDGDEEIVRRKKEDSARRNRAKAIVLEIVQLSGEAPR